MDIINFLLSFLRDPLAILSDLLARYDTLTYVFVGLIIFVETGLVLMPLLPGDSLLFAAGLLSASTHKLEIQMLIPILVAAALLGDNINYFVGKYFSGMIKSHDQILFFKREYITKTEGFYSKHGGKAVILARFVPIIRTMAPFVAGAGSMRYPRYILFCIIGAVLWVVSLTLAGYFLGANEWVKSNFEKVVLGIVFLSIMPIIWHGIKAKLKSSDL